MSPETPSEKELSRLKELHLLAMGKTVEQMTVARDNWVQLVVLATKAFLGWRLLATIEAIAGTISEVGFLQFLGVL